MGLKSSIEWTESTWNPITGCTKISLGCKNCYAERIAKRLQSMGLPNYANGFNLTLHEKALELPLIWKRPQTIFVNSMSDLFHESVPIDFIYRIFDIMKRANWHRYQILTKRSNRLLELDSYLAWEPHIWMGVSVENKDYLSRIDHLRQTHSSIKFLSLEPLLGPLQRLNLKGINWVIVGGESGYEARPMNASWVKDIRDQCQITKVPFFFKQWGGPNRRRAGRKLEGRTWDETPITASIAKTACNY